jgi:hypothetical protein
MDVFVMIAMWEPGTEDVVKVFSTFDKAVAAARKALTDEGVEIAEKDIVSNDVEWTYMCDDVLVTIEKKEVQ